MNEDTEVPGEAKAVSLRQHGALNPQPQDVTDPLFQGSDFFDARDLVQVKYEMLRRVRVDSWSVTAAARAGGFSRPAFYQAQDAFTQAGLPGLLPRRTGPRRAHKLSDAVVDFLVEQRGNDPRLSSQELARQVRRRFRVKVHPRSIERALKRRQKKGPQPPPRPP
jgi:Homeodomain-like domain